MGRQLSLQIVVWCDLRHPIILKTDKKRIPTLIFRIPEKHFFL